jgi:hypothetical protein
MSNGDDLVPKLRERYPAMPAEHMRMIGEICAYWTAVETCVLQAICEITKIDERSMLYLGPERWATLCVLSAFHSSSLTRA